jgi:hypothetical protein
VSTRRELEDRGAVFALLSAVGVALLFLLAYVGIWMLAAPGLYLFLVLGTYALLGGLAIVQAVRAVRATLWLRRVGALGVVFGLAATIFLGLRPRPACLDFGPCQSGLTPQPIQLALGVGIVAVSLFLDDR